MKNDILEHFGILGQKWGIRRYQNPDGTLTPAGKERLKAYRDRETARVKKRFKNDSSIVETSREKNSIRRALKQELKAIQNMTYDDMMKEESYARRETGKKLLVGTGAAIIGGSILATSMGPITGIADFAAKAAIGSGIVEAIAVPIAVLGRKDERSDYRLENTSRKGNYYR